MSHPPPTDLFARAAAELDALWGTLKQKMGGPSLADCEKLYNTHIILVSLLQNDVARLERELKEAREGAMLAAISALEADVAALKLKVDAAKSADEEHV